MKTIPMLLALLLFASQAHAVAIGVNRAGLEFTDILRGGYAEETIMVTTDSETMVSGEVMVQGEAGEWLNYTKEFNFSASQPYALVVNVQPPMDTQLQNYAVNLSVITGEIARSEGGRMGTSTRASFRIPILIKMTGTERLACTAGGLDISDTEIGQESQMRLSILNRGNVRINPEITWEIYDQSRSKLVAQKTIDFGDRILPTVTSKATRTTVFDLPVGQYWAAIKIPMCEFTNLVTFDVLEPGAIKDDGEFLRIDAPSWSNTGDIIPINAVFRNRGARGVRASFRGTITSVETEEVVKVIKTDEYLVEPGQTAELQTFFNPTIAGKYAVSGKVYYNSKLTVGRSTLMNVNGATGKTVSTSRAIVILIVLAIIVLTLLILIKRRREQQRF
jgi:hypothetical protein